MKSKFLDKLLGNTFTEEQFNKMAKEVREATRAEIAISLKESQKKVSIDYAEKTHEGFPEQQMLYWKYLGEFRPDDIPLETYDKMRWDGQIQIGMSALKLPIISRTFWIECENEKIKWFVHSIIKPLWRDLLKSCMLAMDYGFAAHEKVWDIKEDFRVTSDTERPEDKIDFRTSAIIYKKFKSLHPMTIEMKYDDKQNFDGFYQNKNRPQLEVDLPADKCFVYTHNKEWGNIYGWSRLKAAYPYWYGYWVVKGWHERWLGRRGVPPIVVKHPPGQSQFGLNADGTPAFKDNAEIAREVVGSLTPDSVITMPSTENKDSIGNKSGWSIELLNDNSTAVPYIEAMDRYDAMKLRAIIVPERAITQDQSVGSYALAETHVWILMETLKGVISDLEDHINKYIILPLVQANFGDGSPTVRLTIEEVGRELSNAMFELYRQMIVTGQAMPSIKRMEELLNIPSMDEREKAEYEQKQQEQMGGMMGMGMESQFGGAPRTSMGPGMRQARAAQGGYNRSVQSQELGGGAGVSYLSEQANLLARKIDSILMRG